MKSNRNRKIGDRQIYYIYIYIIDILCKSNGKNHFLKTESFFKRRSYCYKMWDVKGLDARHCTHKCTGSCESKFRATGRRFICSAVSLDFAEIIEHKCHVLN